MDISSARLKHTEWRSAVLPGDAGEKESRKTQETYYLYEEAKDPTRWGGAEE